jgi:lysozyme
MVAHVAVNRIAIGALALSASAFVGIAVHEGYRAEAYIPVKGDRPTLGFGDAQGVQMGQKTDPVRALIRLNEQSAVFQRGMRQCIGDVPLHQHEWDAYVSLAFNIGLGKEGVADGFCWRRSGGNSTIVRRLKAFDYAGACEAILAWDKFRGNPLPGLTKRRQAEYKQCMGG